MDACRWPRFCHRNRSSPWQAPGGRARPGDAPSVARRKDVLRLEHLARGKIDEVAGEIDGNRWSHPFAPDGDGDDRRRQPVERKGLGDLALPARVDRVEERRSGKGGKHPVAFGEIHLRVVEAGIGEIDGVSAARSLTRLHDRPLRDEEIGSRSQNLDQPGTLTVAEFQALRPARRLDIAGAKVGLPVRLIAFERTLALALSLPASSA